MPKRSRKNLWWLLAAMVVGAPALFVLVAPLVKIDVTLPLPPARAESPAASPVIPDEATIARLEAQVRLPKGADPLDRYDRYYAFARIAGRLVVQGMYLAPSVDETLHRRPGDPNASKWKRTWRPGLVQRLADPEQFPSGIDWGGCAEVQVLFDVESSRITRLACNPVS